MTNTDPAAVLAGRRILIVDDSPHITALLAETFARCGAEVTALNDGTTAMVLLQLQSYDAILLDLVMPSPGGLDVVAFLEQACPQRLERMIVLTGDRFHHQALQQLRARGVTVCFKPFQIDRLRETVCRRIAACDAVHAA